MALTNYHALEFSVLCWFEKKMKKETKQHKLRKDTRILQTDHLSRGKTKQKKMYKNSWGIKQTKPMKIWKKTNKWQTTYWLTDKCEIKNDADQWMTIWKFIINNYYLCIITITI